MGAVFVLLWFSSGQFKVKTKQAASGVLRTIPFMPTDVLKKGEVVVPVVVVNEHPSLFLKKTDVVSFDQVTKHFRDYFLDYNLTSLNVHLTAEPQYINQATILPTGERERIVGFSANKEEPEAHIYLFIDHEVWQESNWTEAYTQQELENLLIMGLVLLRRSYEKIEPKEVSREASSLYRLVDYDKNHQPLFELELRQQ